MNEENIPDENPQPPETRKFDWKSTLRDVLETLGLAVVLFLAINLVSARVRVDGFSMRPTLENGQFVLVSRLAYLDGEFERGDIVVFRPPMYPEEAAWRHYLGLPGFSAYEDYIKRVIGLPGETVRIENGQVFINGALLEEPYIAAPPQYSGIWQVPEGHLFVLGDNRNNSSDSHSWGPLPVENVVGKAVLIYWPLRDWMVLRNQDALAAP
ncbi:MAG: signal peptidase I [Anaerolineales bacterium]